MRNKLAKNWPKEIAQDLKAICGLDAETELANLISKEIHDELNREIIKGIYSQMQLPVFSYPKFRDGLLSKVVIELDEQGRYSVETFTQLMNKLES